MLTAGRLWEAVRPSWQRTRDRLCRPERLGQVVASLCWIASTLTYGVVSGGDWLQLFAASAWLLANLAAIVKTEED